jgi:hypothetical protein
MKSPLTTSLRKQTPMIKKRYQMLPQKNKI